MIETERSSPRLDDYIGDSTLVARDRRRVLDLLAQRRLGLNSFTKVTSVRGIPYFLFGYGILMIVGLTWYFSNSPWNWLVLGCIPFIQHAFFNTVHEASHFSLSPNSKLNDLYGNLFAFPIGTTVESYRIVHVDHHRYLNSPKDPSIATTRQGESSASVIRGLLLGLCGRYLFLLLMGVLKGNQGVTPSIEAATQRRRFKLMVLFHVGLLGVATLSGFFWFWLAWVVSANSFLPLLESIRTIVEHRKTKGDSPTFHTRSHHKTLLLSAITAPFFQYHWEHHLFPAIPHYHLKRLHRILVEEKLPEVKPVFFYRSLFNILTEKNSVN